MAEQQRQADLQTERMAFLDSDPADLDPQAGWLSADYWAKNSQIVSRFSALNDTAEQEQSHAQGQTQPDWQTDLENEALEPCNEFAHDATFNIDWYDPEGVAVDHRTSQDAFAVPQISAMPHAFANHDWSGLESFGVGTGQGDHHGCAIANQQDSDRHQVHEGPGNGAEGSRPAMSLQLHMARTSESLHQNSFSEMPEVSSLPEANHSMPPASEATPEASLSRPKQRRRATAGRGKVLAARNVDKARKLKCETCKEGAQRAAEHIPGEYDDLTLCDRHQKAWTSKHGEIIWWEFQHWDPEDAINRIRPDFEPPEAYTDPEYFDRTFWENYDKAGEWSRRFLDAIQTPYIYEGEGEPEKHSMERKLLDHQTALRFRARGRRGKENGFQYREDMVNARITLLFHIALRFHSGGKAIYCTGGDNWGFREGSTLTFLERLEMIEDALKRNKRVAMDVIEGRGVEALVKNPVQVQERKNTNNKNNPRRPYKGVRHGADEAGDSGANTRSVTPSQVDSGSSPLPGGQGPGPTTGTKAAGAGPSKRKWPVKDDTDTSAEELEQPSAAKKKRNSSWNQSTNVPATPNFSDSEHATLLAGPSSKANLQKPPQYQPSASAGAQSFSHPRSSSGQGISFFDSDSLPPFSSFSLGTQDPMMPFRVPGMPGIFSDFGDHGVSSAAQQTTEGHASTASGSSFGPTLQDAEMHSYQSGRAEPGDPTASSGRSFGPTVQHAKAHFHSPSPSLRVHSEAQNSRMPPSPMPTATSPLRNSSLPPGSQVQSNSSSGAQCQYPQKPGQHGSSSHLSPSWGQQAIEGPSGQLSRMSLSPAPSSGNDRSPVTRPQTSPSPRVGSGQSAGRGSQSTFNISASPLRPLQRFPPPAQWPTGASQCLPTTPQYIDPALLTKGHQFESILEQLQGIQPQLWHQGPAPNTQSSYQNPSLDTQAGSHLGGRMPSRDMPTPGVQPMTGTLDSGENAPRQTVSRPASGRSADQTALGTTLAIKQSAEKQYSGPWTRTISRRWQDLWLQEGSRFAKD